MIGTEGSSGSTIDVRESRLRVLAACAATTIAGWALFVASQIPGFTGLQAFSWTAGTIWGALICAALVVRALGRQRNKGPWLLALAHSMNLPWLFLVRRAAKPMAEHNSGYMPLAVASICVLFVVGFVGYRLEPKRLFSDRPSTD